MIHGVRPFFFSRWPFVTCRGGWALDGFFAVERSRFGCPPMLAKRTVACTCLPRVRLDAFGASDLLQPGMSEDYELPVSNEEWFGWALTPAPDTRLKEMVEVGRRHACTWARSNGRNVS